MVEWVDTPGFRETDDPIERAAISAARAALRDATLLVEVAAPDVETLPESLEPASATDVLRIWNKTDLAPPSEGDQRFPISAETGVGIVELARMVRDRLVDADDLASSGRWCFHPSLAES